MMVTALRVSSVPRSGERSIFADRILELNISQLALSQHWWGMVGARADGRDRVMMTALWSEVVSWSTTSVKMDCVGKPQEKHKSMVDGCPPFLGWCVGIAGLYWRLKLLSSSKFAIVGLAV